MEAANRLNMTQALQLLKNLGLEANRLLEAQAREADLRPPFYSLLSLVSGAGEAGMTVTQAAAQLAVTSQALSGTVRELVEKGLLLRQVDPNDARARRLAITPQGRERLALALPLEDRLLDEMLRQIPSPQVARLVLARLQTALTRVLLPGSQG